MLVRELLMAALPPVSNAQLALMAVIVLLAIVAPRLVRRNWQRRAGPDLAEVRERVRELESGDQARRSAERALVDLLEASREINARIDTKIRILNKLVKDADDEARRLEKLLGFARGADAGALPARPGEAKTAAGAGRAPVPAKAVDKGDEDGRRPSRSTRRARDLRARVELMRAAGRPVAEIARLTGLSLQEISMLSHMEQAENGKQAAGLQEGERRESRG